MKINSVQNNVVTHMPQNHSGADYTIETNSKMFEILFSGIYQHKIAAIVREITTNAYDSHVEAGIPDTPFKVTIPNPKHPYFEVEDFGIGMDVESALRVYTVMGRSTKTDSNNLAGAWGLGSKTPFAYTSQYTIRIRKDGIERTAIAYINESHGPRLDFVSEQKTQEPNGVKVTVPVKESDIEEFRREASFYLSFYDVSPIVIGQNFSFAYDILNRFGEYSFYELNGNTGYHSSGRKSMYVLSGPVAYPFSVTDVLDDSSYVSFFYNTTSAQRPIVIHSEIGDVEPSTSRESLQMTQQTKKFLNGVLTKIVDETRKEYVRIMNDTNIHITHRIGRAREVLGDGIVDLFIRNYSGLEDVAELLWVRNFLHERRVTLLENRYTNKTRFIHAKGWNLSDFFDKSREHGINSITFVTNTKNTKIRKSTMDGFAPKNCMFVGYMTQSTANRISKAIGADVFVEDYSKYHSLMLEHRRKNRTPSLIVRNSYEDNEISGSFFRYKVVNGEGRVDYLTSQPPTDVENIETYYIPARDRDFHVFGKQFERDDVLEILLNCIDPKKVKSEQIRIIRMNDQNEKKIFRNDIPSIDELIGGEYSYDMKDICVGCIMGELSYSKTQKLDLILKSGFVKNHWISSMMGENNKTSFSRWMLRRLYPDVNDRVSAVWGYINDVLLRFDAFVEDDAPLLLGVSLNVDVNHKIWYINKVIEMKKEN